MYKAIPNNAYSSKPYYPFGMIMPGRSYTAASSYRFGFNKGSLKDNELYGEGNSYTTEFRELDTRTGGRWWGVDPKSNTYESPYIGFGNNPVLYSDPNGDFKIDPKDAKDPQKKKDLDAIIAHLKAEFNNYSQQQWKTMCSIYGARTDAAGIAKVKSEVMQWFEDGNGPTIRFSSIDECKRVQTNCDDPNQSKFVPGLNNDRNHTKKEGVEDGNFDPSTNTITIDGRYERIITNYLNNTSQKDPSTVNTFGFLNKTVNGNTSKYLFAEGKAIFNLTNGIVGHELTHYGASMYGGEDSKPSDPRNNCEAGFQYELHIRGGVIQYNNSNSFNVYQHFNAILSCTNSHWLDMKCKTEFLRLYPGLINMNRVNTINEDENRKQQTK